MSDLLTVDQAAGELGISARRVRMLIAESTLKAEKVGRDWLIRSKDLDKVRDRKPGRPPKAQ